MQELRYVDAAAENLTETVLRQKFMASETTHDNEYRIHAADVGNVCCSRKLGEAEERFVSFFDLGAACTA
jgi:hypothetical protein